MFPLRMLLFFITPEKPPLLGTVLDGNFVAISVLREDPFFRGCSAIVPARALRKVSSTASVWSITSDKDKTVYYFKLRIISTCSTVPRPV